MERLHGRAGFGLKRLAALLVVVAAAAFLFLLWKLDPATIWRYCRAVGWGMAFLLLQAIAAHVINAFGWRFAFVPDAGARRPWLELLRLRIAGDGVNYLTPSATIGGEFLRAAALNGCRPVDSDYASVVVGKFAQSLGQALFILLGCVFILWEGESFFPRHQHAVRVAAVAMGSALALLALAGVWIWRRLSRRTGGVAPGAARSGHWLAALKDMPRQCLEFVRFHPGRFAASVCFFMAGYAWCILEAWWTCLFIGTPVALATAAGIEILSNLANGVFFMVPAKVGTMEAGAAAIFAGFGLSAGAGFAFGVIRHVRELAWAGAGLLLCPLDWRRTARKPSEQNP